MHDPMTVAFEIRYPWKKYKAPRNDFERKYRESFITIWHVDPERDGTDDSCDWFNYKCNLTPELARIREAMWDVETILDNAPHYPDSVEHKRWSVLRGNLNMLLRQPSRTHWWQLHPRWHVWHWKIQVHPVQHFKRWAFSRCSGCGGRFLWGYAPVSGQWGGKGPRWFRREDYAVYHEQCYPHNDKIDQPQAEKEQPHE